MSLLLLDHSLPYKVEATFKLFKASLIVGYDIHFRQAMLLTLSIQEKL